MTVQIIAHDGEPEYAVLPGPIIRLCCTLPGANRWSRKPALLSQWQNSIGPDSISCAGCVRPRA